MAVGAARPAIRHREPAGCRRQYRHRSGSARACRRLYAAPVGGDATRSTRRFTTSSISISSETSRRLRPSFALANVLDVNLSVPAKTVPEFIAYAKANPGKINMASVGNGSTPHVTGELFKMMAGVNMVHVPYRSAGAALTDLISGQVQVYFANYRVLDRTHQSWQAARPGVTTATRSEALPDIPTVGEFVPGYEASFWFGIGAPKDTPAEIVESSTRRSTRRSPIPRSRRGSLTSAARRCRARRSSSASSSPKKPRNGAR